ncbi:hypothetical protein EJ05DRAFT_477740 [Pseudovirgaria hyperparasitica]|uniref:Telomere length regulation protein conserved domain-containing protein n=1 Tax=Pseudovirgaria hyperparasitica TaxID=470096 RepID=A0A6A6W245_9PEZI|nr:uncharacterized protein EJ05DRAFT_477740 [Pseudovirgaria hyperparasitica]KAF2756633.1 hypothetical protein EJ05DRAFT_477740 [Pseudovirgaria hyperparasitica]
MDDFLTPVTVTKRDNSRALHNTPVKATVKTITSPQDALAILRAQPDIHALETVLGWLNNDQPDFSMADPAPSSSQIIYTLVNSTLPDYWQTLVQSRSKNVPILVGVLRTVSGLGALLARLRTLITQRGQKDEPRNAEITRQHLEDAVSILASVLDGNQTSRKIYDSLLCSVKNDMRRSLAWKEYIAQIAGGKVLSVVAQAEEILKKGSKQYDGSWLADGTRFAAWLGHNIAVMVCAVEGENRADIQMAAARLTGKALSLGHRNRLVKEIISMALENGNHISLSGWIPKLQNNEQCRFLDSCLSDSIPQLMEANARIPLDARPRIAGAAALIQTLISESPILKDALSSWLVKCSTTGVDPSVLVIRAVVAIVALDEDRLQTLTEKLMADFGDSLYIRHTPILVQECLTRTLLLCFGHIHRKQSMALFMLARSSTHMTAISNRLSASSPRARFLGMAVGQIVSGLVDNSETVMKFDFDASEKEDLEMLRQLVSFEDTIGNVEDLTQAGLPKKDKGIEAKKRPATKSQTVARTSTQTQISGPRIVEVLDDSDEDEDLVPYSKPDSDPEDEDDDPSMVKRDKPTAPVYIRDLMSSVRDTENYDRHILAFRAAPALIRRKTGFGKEVIDHIGDLAGLFIGLTDHFELDEEFDEVRQQALIAILLAQPASIGKVYARAYFEGEYSISQRLAILSAMGLGARELAGFEDFEQDQKIKEASKAFPSKKLPPHLHQIYADESQPVAALSRRLEQMMIKPMALQAADKASGPNILKVRTFSSRMEVEKKRKKPIANELAKVVAQSFFFPLTGRWWSHVQAYGPSTIQSTPHLLPTYLRTLSLLLHSSGPSTLSLPSMTSEFWDLLLSLRTVATGDITIMEAMLFSILTLLDVNEDHRRIAQEHPKELLETQVWVKGVWEAMGKGSEGSQDERVRMLAASILVRSQEVVEKYQRMLMGDMMVLDK